MKYLFEHYQIWARNVIGKKLKAVNGLIYIFEVPNFMTPQQLQFVFISNNHDPSFHCSKDGATLEITYSTMQESDLEEYGKEIIMNISNSHLFHKFIGSVLLKSYIIYSEVEKTIIGIKLVFDNMLTLLVINLGDEINILDSLSLEYERSEGIRYFDLIDQRKDE